VPERPELLIGLKYDALVGSLFVTVVKGKYLCDRNSPDKSLSKIRRKFDFFANARLMAMNF
jgi:hypothetical protein